MRTKNLFMTALAALMLASCAEEAYLGDKSQLATNGDGSISFSMSTPTVTRASGAGAATALTNKFKVYAVKYDGSAYSNVFAKEEFDNDADYNATPYWVWYATSTAGTTTSNTSNWEYVGTGGGVVTPAIDPAQTIKYWDYGADKYEFVAYSATVGTPTISKYQKDGFTVNATAAQLAGLYIADKLTINTKNNTPSKPASGENQIGNIVKFTFRAAAAKVRLGIYETIPGYDVKNVSFRPNDAEFSATTDNAKLSGSFNGTSSGASGTYNITYNGSTGIAEYDATASAANYFDFGTFASASTKLGETSIDPMWATGSTDYQSVLPNTDNVANMILKVDYDLVNTTSGETISVKGAKAVVPQMYMTWNPNYAYTYLFKISDNTNGTTGTEDTNPEGLYPITFDAVTVAAADGQEVGIITTVSTPAITTYQNSSVSTAGITYANANGAIYVTVNTDGTLADLTTSNTKLYTVTSGTTEADLILTTKTKTAVTAGDDVLSILAANETSQGITFASGKAAKFTPNADTTYAIEYRVSAAVDAVYTAVSNGTTLTLGNTYYTSDAGAGEFVSNGTEIADGSNYYTLTTPAAPAVYQYKIIEVAAAP